MELYTYCLKGTSSSNTGPTYDHTYGTDYGRYLYIESSSPRTQGDKARVISSPYSHDPTDGNGYECVTFYYHMFGSTMGSLFLYKTNGLDADGEALGDPIWKLKGDQGNYWHVAQVR